MKMTSVHCSKVATIYEEEKPPPSRRDERDGTRLYVPRPRIQPWYVPERQPLSLQLSSSVPGEEIFRGKSGFPFRGQPDASNFFVLSFFSFHVFKFIPHIERKCSINLITVFFYQGKKSYGNKSNVGVERILHSMSEIICIHIQLDNFEDNNYW